ncbi:uncharacterized protein, partial [Syngnathus scovelli]|uniref:uncharacterized protein n=1 Tax=Syngnathus scovelli TaxID=161590 RepID=UPI0035CA5848
LISFLSIYQCLLTLACSPISPNYQHEEAGSEQVMTLQKCGTHTAPTGQRVFIRRRSRSDLLVPLVTQSQRQSIKTTTKTTKTSSQQSVFFFGVLHFLFLQVRINMQEKSAVPLRKRSLYLLMLLLLLSQQVSPALTGLSASGLNDSSVHVCACLWQVCSGPLASPVQSPYSAHKRLARMSPLWRIMNSKPFGAFCQNNYECSTGLCRYCCRHSQSNAAAPHLIGEKKKS